VCVRASSWCVVLASGGVVRQRGKDINLEKKTKEEEEGLVVVRDIILRWWDRTRERVTRVSSVNVSL
jgi:hypothetical protein